MNCLPSSAEKHHLRQCTAGLFFDRFCGGCLCLFFDWRAASEEVRTVHVLVSSFDLVELFERFPSIVWCQFFLVLGFMKIWRERRSFLPYALLFNTTTGLRFLELSDLHVRELFLGGSEALEASLSMDALSIHVRPWRSRFPSAWTIPLSFETLAESVLLLVSVL